MNEYLIEILNVVALKSNELSIEIAQIEDELEAFAVSGNLWEDLAQYKKLYSQIIDYYEKKGVLYRIDGNRPIGRVFHEIDCIIKGSENK